MRHRLWLLLLIAGLAVMARPAGRRARKVWHGWQASAAWNAVRDQPFAGEDGEPYCWLNIPASSISQLVRFGPDGSRLSYSPCAEANGNSILIMAHRDSHFHRLGQVREGDLIELELRARVFQTYRCHETMVVDKIGVEDVVISQLANGRLVLLTCYPFRYIGPAPRRYIVICEKVPPGSGS